MSSSKIALLGAIAGFTIFLGLPLGRLRMPLPRLRALLNATAIGILLFLFFDVLKHAWDPIDGALSAKPEHHIGTALQYGAIMTVGFGLALCGLTRFDRWVAKRSAHGPGAAAAAELSGAKTPTRTRLLARLASLPMLIAIGIGLHNFAEGLAIGNSAADPGPDGLKLAILLIVGFGLHNATEGFGIVAPMAATGVRPSWGYLGVLGLIGGAPTFLGTVVGEQFTSAAVSVAFLALAGGSILYVVIELLAVARKTAMKELTSYGILLGLVLGFVTDAVVTLGGA
jgi:ZIP family zinc transporter